MVTVELLTVKSPGTVTAPGKPLRLMAPPVVDRFPLPVTSAPVKDSEMAPIVIVLVELVASAFWLSVSEKPVAFVPVKETSVVPPGMLGPPTAMPTVGTKDAPPAKALAAVVTVGVPMVVPDVAALAGGANVIWLLVAAVTPVAVVMVTTFPAMPVMNSLAGIPVPETAMPTNSPVVFGTVKVLFVTVTVPTVCTICGDSVTVPPPFRITLSGVAPLLAIGELIVATPVPNEFRYNELVPEVSEPPWIATD